jgi:Major Facilitator Superfamily
MKHQTKQSRALKFVLLIGVVSFFADFTYEGSRSVTGPFLAVLGASGTAVGIIAGLGELLGYGLRILSGQFAESTRRFWPITLFGYVIQMAAVPLLAFAGNWQTAALLILTERIGKAIPNPPRDVMLSHAAKEMGYGWGFGIHEALDQFGALFGPLLVAAIFFYRGDYRAAFAVLVVPAAIVLVLLIFARILYPRPEDLESSAQDLQTAGLPRIFWLYVLGAALDAAGFAHFSLVAYHFGKFSHIAPVSIPIFYSVAMAVSGIGSLAFGRFSTGQVFPS